ncbi:hypothetical protein [Flavihumibacter fluvii]|uniref:hypothetical protein n=1 Tax=Flavihumibacter fluvii TaxID=2838157 RepID=UPI001BDE937C|nr:hypothetical protein [Flavihumibacter fluvii]ULQ54662.1 hypothetical protein KJS93_10060 [Flavihumibacter fluvii]
MQNLKTLVNELFEQDQLTNALAKDIKTKTAQYNHLLLKNTEKVYSDAEVIAINTVHEELLQLRARQEAIAATSNGIKYQLKSFIIPLNGGRWLHETEEILEPNWEFWLEDDELKYARMNGRNY